MSAFGGWLFRLAVISGALTILCGCVVTIDEQTVFRPPSVAHKASSPSQMYLAGEEALPADARHEFLLAGELRIAVTHVTLGTTRANRPLILVCMGNASDRHRNGAAYASRLLPYGDVLLFDYPGYGDSTGSPSAANILSVINPLMQYASGMAGDQPILLWGHSLGGFVCAEMASTPYPVSGVVFETTAANAHEVAEAWKPWYLPILRIRVDEGLAEFDIPTALTKFDAPVLVLGARRDRTLPVTLHRSLAAALEADGRCVTYLEYPAANHYDVPSQPGFSRDTAPFFASAVAGECAGTR